LENLEEEMLCIGGGRILRIGKERKMIKGKEDKEPWKTSKDEEVNNEGKELLNLVEDRGWDITKMRGDEKRELTYIGRRWESVVDYISVNQKA